MASDTVSPNEELAELLGDPEDSRTASEVEDTIRKLEGIISAKPQNLYRDELVDGKIQLLDPKDWPEAECSAIVEMNATNAGMRIRFADKAKAFDMVARLKGHYKQEDAAANPLEAAFARLPREQLLKLAEVLGHLIKTVETDAGTP